MFWINRIQGQRAIARFCIFALFALNLSVIHHHLDAHPEEHSTHHCQLFAHVNTGVIPSTPQLNVPTINATPLNPSWIEHRNTTVRRYAARAPPNINLKLS